MMMMMQEVGEEEKMQPDDQTDVGVGILKNFIRTFHSTPHLSVSLKFRTGNNERVS
jgi:hypothetical protein